jgi:hypothetical protein
VKSKETQLSAFVGLSLYKNVRFGNSLSPSSQEKRKINNYSAGPCRLSPDIKNLSGATESILILFSA